MQEPELLTADAAINLALGVGLLFFPEPLAGALGIPVPPVPFYASILGAVLFGIGLALLVEGYRPVEGATGLGLGGAICINICGGLVLAAWLIGGQLSMPVRGYVFLWALVVLLLVISTFEIQAHWRR